MRRDGRARRAARATQLVPGDIVAVEAGDIIPADGRLLACGDARGRRVGADRRERPGLEGRSTPSRARTSPLGDRTDMVFMNTNVTRGTAQFVVTATGMETEVGHISGMLQRQDETETPLTRQLAEADEADPLHRRRRGRDLDDHQPAPAATTFTDGLHRRDRVRGLGDPDRACPAVVTTILSLGTQHAREGERDREAPALDRDARLDIGDQLRQDRHADAQPDDRGRADDPWPPLHDLRERLLDGGEDQARRRDSRTSRSSSSCCR